MAAHPNLRHRWRGNGTHCKCLRCGVNKEAWVVQSIVRRKPLPCPGCRNGPRVGTEVPFPPALGRGRTLRFVRRRDVASVLTFCSVGVRLLRRVRRAVKRALEKAWTQVEEYRGCPELYSSL